MRKQLRQMSIVVITAFCLTGWTVSGQKQNRRIQRPPVHAPIIAWEYRTTGSISQEEMNKLGAEGWELAGVIAPNIDNIGFIFKRRKR
jgi:hypothetical protein